MLHHVPGSDVRVASPAPAARRPALSNGAQAWTSQPTPHQVRGAARPAAVAPGTRAGGARSLCSCGSTFSFNRSEGLLPKPLGARIARASCTSDSGAAPHPSGRFFGPVHGGGGGGRLAAVLGKARSVAAIAAPRCAAALGRARSAARTRSRAGAPSLRDTNGAERGGSSVRALRRGLRDLEGGDNSGVTSAELQ